MLKQYPIFSCNDICDCCLTEAEKTHRAIEKEIEQMRMKNLYTGKVILLGE